MFRALALVLMGSWLAACRSAEVRAKPIEECARTECRHERSMGMPNWVCEDGSRGGPLCARRPDGGCGWTVNNCPPAKDRARVAPPPPPPPPAPAPEPPPPPKPCPKRLPPRKVLRTWKIQLVCGPGSSYAATPPDFKPTYPKPILDLGDGTFITEQQGLGCFRAKLERCLRKCLPGDTAIATPAGDVPVSRLRPGNVVWTRDRDGNRIAGRVLRIHREAIAAPHAVVRLVLSDGRAVTASAGHPDLAGRPLETLGTGEWYDGARIEAVRIEPFPGRETYDLLPAGSTGVYWADGVPLGSTLAWD